MTSNASSDGPTPPAALAALAHQQPELVAVSDLVVADSPRLLGENDEVVQTLMQTESHLPPIVVHRQTMRIIDGMHRYRAAVQRHDETMLVHFCDGTDDEAFVLAVQTNIAHGLPLTLADRRAAAVRLMRSFSDWSNRAIAEVTGLAAKTVDGIRRSSEDSTQLNVKRMGRDGRLRPVDCSYGRRRASEAIARRPEAPLRQIADEVGVSLGTVRDVRNRIRHGQDPVLPRRRSRDEDDPAGKSAARALDEAAGRLSQTNAVRVQLSRDPAVRMTDSGRSLLRFLEGRALTPRDLKAFVERTPPHCRSTLANLARSYRDIWNDVADALDRSAAAETA